MSQIYAEYPLTLIQFIPGLFQELDGIPKPWKNLQMKLKKKRSGKKNPPIYDFKSFKGIQLKILQVVLY